MDQTDHRSPQDDGRGEAADSAADIGTMPEQVRDALRRRLLVGGAVAAPMVVTFGRKAMAQAGVSLDCFSKANLVNPNPQSPQVTVSDIRENFLPGVGGTFDPATRLPTNDQAIAFDNLINSAGGALTVGDDGVLRVTFQTDGGCLGSHGITVFADST